MFGGDTYHASVAEPSIQQVVDTSIIDGDNLKTNMQWASNPGSLYALASIAIAYFAWNYLQNKEGIRAGMYSLQNWHTSTFLLYHVLQDLCCLFSTYKSMKILGLLMVLIGGVFVYGGVNGKKWREVLKLQTGTTRTW